MRSHTECIKLVLKTTLKQYSAVINLTFRYDLSTRQLIRTAQPNTVNRYSEVVLKYVVHVKGELINMTRAWDKEKNLSPRQESNP